MSPPSQSLTTSPTGTLYFAFGTNLSPTQMSIRCTTSPVRSSTPIATARLPNWKWFICRRGCANLIRTPASNGEDDTAARNEVWGVLYDMHPSDEATLDTYEGVDDTAPLIIPTSIERPREQGRGRHNKIYLEVEVVRWIDERWGDEVGGSKTRVLVYVDERDVEEGVVRDNYIGRMNRGVREAVGLGLSEEWVGEVVRRGVPEGIEAEEGYVGGENRGLGGGR